MNCEEKVTDVMHRSKQKICIIQCKVVNFYYKMLQSFPGWQQGNHSRKAFALETLTVESNDKSCRSLRAMNFRSMALSSQKSTDMFEKYGLKVFCLGQQSDKRQLNSLRTIINY